MLRGHVAADFDECVSMWADPLMMHFISGRALSGEEVWTRVLRNAGLWPLLGYGYWVVCERESGRFVGEVGLADFHRDLTPSFGDAPEAGWALASWARGRGYATEALSAVLAWRDVHLINTSPASNRTVCMISPANSASMKVAERCGFRPVAETTYREHPTFVFERPGR